MQLICLITLIFMNGAYLFVSFNMELLIPDESEEKIEEVIVTLSTGTDFDPADLLDLDIFDFDVEELAGGNEGSGFTSTSSRRAEDLIAR